jgi:hypothetical protein
VDKLELRPKIIAPPADHRGKLRCHVDSQPFDVPVAKETVENWISDMESEAEHLWNEANEDEKDTE